MKSFALLICFILGILAMAAPASGQAKMSVGWLEKVRIFPGNLLIHAKLDTGAKTCSLNAPHITEFSRDGEKWVRFGVTNKYGDKITLERKVNRVASIKRHGVEVQKRFVIHLAICLGTLYKEVEVNLVDRRDFLYPMLIGRSFMAGNLVVDPAAKYTTKPSCKETPQP